MDIIEKPFMECNSCVLSVASLCGSCIHNRALISDLQSELRAFRMMTKLVVKGLARILKS